MSFNNASGAKFQQSFSPQQNMDSNQQSHIPSDAFHASSSGNSQSLQMIEELFQRSDVLLIKDRDYDQAEGLYRQILQLDPSNIDAINSVAYCIKFRNDDSGDTNGNKLKSEELFNQMHSMYLEALKLDKNDIEANFNLGLLFLQNKQDLNQALFYFQQSIKKDKPLQTQQQQLSSQLGTQSSTSSKKYDSNTVYSTQLQEVYRPQFAKAYYNIGMIYDRLGEIHKASQNYKKSIEKCQSDESGNLMKAPQYMKAVTNYAVTLEKLGKRNDSIKTLDSLKGTFREEIRIYNNLGIIYKRNGNLEAAQSNYDIALHIDQNSFFPNYNLAVLKAQNMKDLSSQDGSGDQTEECLQYFEKALKIAHDSKEEVYEINVLVNMALVYERMIEYDKAIECLEKALLIDKENQKIKQKLNQLRQQVQKMSDKIQKDLEKKLKEDEKMAKEQRDMVDAKGKKKDEEKSIKKTTTIKEEEKDKKSQVQQSVSKEDTKQKTNRQKSIEKPQKQQTGKDKSPPSKSNQLSSNSSVKASSQTNKQKIMEEPQASKQIESQQTTKPYLEKHINEQTNSQNTPYDDSGKQDTDSLRGSLQENTSNIQQLTTDRIAKKQGIDERPVSSTSRQSNHGIIKSLSNTHASNMYNNSTINNAESGIVKKQLSKNLNDIVVKLGEETLKEVTDVRASVKTQQLIDEEQKEEEEHKKDNNEIALDNAEGVDGNNIGEGYEDINENQLDDQVVVQESDIQYQSNNKSEKVLEEEKSQELQRKQELSSNGVRSSISSLNQDNPALKVMSSSQKDKMIKQQKLDHQLQQEIIQKQASVINDVASSHDKASTLSQQDDNNAQWTAEQCEELLKQNPQNLNALYRLGILQYNAKKLPQALAYLEQIYAKNPIFQKEELLLKLGEICYKLSDVQSSGVTIEKALDYFETAGKVIQPQKNYELEIGKGKCLDKAKRFTEACQQYEKALKIMSQSQQVDNSVKGNIEFRLGWSYIRSKNNIASGVNHLKLAQTLMPQNTDVLIKLASVLFKEYPSTSTSECLEYLRKAIQVQPKNDEALILLAKILEKSGQFQEAIEIIEQAIKVQAEGNALPKANTFFQLGCCFEKIKEYKKCVLNYKKCLTLDNRNFGACIHLANLLANIGEGQRAAKYFKHALRIDPESLNAHFGMGKALQQFSDNKEAPITHFNFVINKDPNHYKAFTQLGILHLDREEYEKSAESLKRALNINKQYPLALVSMGNLLFESGNAENAIKYHKQALKFNNKELQALIGLGNAYYDSGKPNESIQFYKNALEIDDQLSDVHYNLGNALYLIEKIEEAISHYRSAISLNPKKSESYYNLGNALCVKQEYQNAITSYQQALEIDPKNAPALYNLGNAYYMQNRFEEAIKVYVKALELNEQSPECHFNLASAFNDLSNFQKSAQHYQRAIELDDKNVDAYICLGQVLEQLKQFDKAEKAYILALSKEPDNERAKDNLKKIRERKNI